MKNRPSFPSPTGWIPTIGFTLLILSCTSEHDAPGDRSFEGLTPAPTTGGTGPNPSTT
ncbi:MAG: hypothetical protein R2751_15770 [Bacteroidales bacterium]